MLFRCVIKAVTIGWTRSRGLEDEVERCIDNFREKHSGIIKTKQDVG
jgi:hypothetical protein